MNLDVFAEIGLLFAVAALVSLVMRLLRQPLIIGHIITGFLVGQFALGLFPDTETLELFSKLGISFLLFSVGLTLNPKVLRDYGAVSILTGFGQVFLTGVVGVAVALSLGFEWITSLYVGVALSFSSTVIVMKLLSDKGDLDKLYVKLSIGSLLLQDLVAIVLLFAIPFVSGAQGTGSELVRILGLGIASAVGVFIFSHYVIRHLHRYLTRSQELLFLFTTAWGICVSSLFAQIGFSLEGGALIAGVALSTLPSRHEMGARLAPLRDFFIVAFFVLLGTQMVVSDFAAILEPAVIFSLFVLIGNPLLQLIIMGTLGYRKKTSFQTGMMAAQISEFSLILIALGVSLGQVPPEVLSIVTLVGIITIFISSYLILYSDTLYKHLAPYLGVFERRVVRERTVRTTKYPVLLIGGGRIGEDFVSLFTKEEIHFQVLDHDPEVIGRLAHDGVPHEYGEANDPDLLEDLRVPQAELIVSTIPDLDTNLVILSVAKRIAKGPVVIVAAHRIHHALELYAAGADYVILPHFLGGSYAASLVKRFTRDAVELQDIRDKHISQLRTRAGHGQEHPEFEHSR
jgi:Kef-type K+ transport system membrane component KefB